MREHPNGSEITRLLAGVRSGDSDAFQKLLPVVYDELKILARGQLRRGRSPTLGTTALVHEAYIKLAHQSDPAWDDRAHFLAVAATAMRHLAVDHARSRNAEKRGGGRSPLTLDRIDLAAPEPEEQVLAVDAALRRLEAEDPRLARVVECRFFGGMTEAEIAEAQGVTERTVRRDWVKAKAWLHDEMAGGV